MARFIQYIDDDGTENIVNVDSIVKFELNREQEDLIVVFNTLVRVAWDCLREWLAMPSMCNDVLNIELAISERRKR